MAAMLGLAGWNASPVAASVFDKGKGILTIQDDDDAEHAGGYRWGLSQAQGQEFVQYLSEENADNTLTIKFGDKTGGIEIKERIKANLAITKQLMDSDFGGDAEARRAFVGALSKIKRVSIIFNENAEIDSELVTKFVELLAPSQKIELSIMASNSEVDLTTIGDSLKIEKAGVTVGADGVIKLNQLIAGKVKLKGDYDYSNVQYLEMMGIISAEVENTDNWIGVTGDAKYVIYGFDIPDLSAPDHHKIVVNRVKDNGLTALKKKLKSKGDVITAFDIEARTGNNDLINDFPEKIRLTLKLDGDLYKKLLEKKAFLYHVHGGNVSKVEIADGALVEEGLMKLVTFGVDSFSQFAFVGKKTHNSGNPGGPSNGGGQTPSQTPQTPNQSTGEITTAPEGELKAPDTGVVEEVADAEELELLGMMTCIVVLAGAAKLGLKR